MFKLQTMCPPATVPRNRTDAIPPHALTKRLVNHAPPNDVTEGYAADWTIGQLREPAQRIADRIEALTRAEADNLIGNKAAPGCA